MKSRLDVVICVVACLMLTVGARGQEIAPDGNAHPSVQMLSGAPGELANPFGEPARESFATPAQKLEFALALDLEPLRDLAVSHSGRVKILDTLARETVREITGKTRYPDPVETPSGVELEKYDPLFTLFDLIIDQGYYMDRPLIYVDYLPLRERILEIVYPQDEQLRERYKTLTRLTPEDVSLGGQRILASGDIEGQMSMGLQRISARLGMWGSSMRNLMVIAPESATAKYHHLSELDPSHPARAAALELGRAWRARDADAANSAIRTLAEQLPKINADRYPTLRRSLELTYNKANAFEWGMWLYFVALLSLVLAFATGRRWLVYLGTGTLLLAIGIHFTGFVLRCIIAERFAIQNQFESMTGLSLFATLVGLGVMTLKRQWLFGAAAAGVGFLVLITATQTGIPGVNVQKEAAILNTSVLLKYHVTTVLVSYGLISLGFIISLFYLGTYYAGKLKARAEVGAEPGAESIAAHALGLDESVNVGRQRVLADLDRALMTILQLAFWTLAVGIMLGAWWADHSWGRWWAFDPKETWALATWIIYLIVIHVRQVATKNRQLVTAWLGVLGFIVMLWTYFGVNLLLPGLHAYA
jgi:cytochrome c-type biogenesis protein CcsB